ncbi:MAG: hypothetical protein IPK85_17070 [Gemmatimonadetes bacterium]|nr:hypothetical protein [Gemmatimonadota bacterium]
MALLLLSATVAPGQELRARGRVMLASESGERAVPGAMVTLHQIGPTSGPVDSARTDAAGRYAFRISRPDTGAMYLATSRYSGIAYFAPPVRVSDSLEAPGEIHVFDTTSVDAPLRQVGRHVVVSAPNAQGLREVVEVWELGNEGRRTRTSPPGRPAFVTQVPAAATNVRSTQGDFAGSGSEVDGRDVRVIAPVAPGVRQLVVTYDLVPGAFPLTVAVPDSTAVLEVLLEEAGASVDDPRLRALGAVPSEGRNFLRFLGDDVPPGPLTIRVAPPAVNASSWPWMLGLGALSAAAVVWALRPARGLPAAAARPAVPGERDALQAMEAALTMQLEGPALDPVDRRRLEEHRASVREALDAIARGTPPG